MNKKPSKRSKQPKNQQYKSQSLSFNTGNMLGHPSRHSVFQKRKQQQAIKREARVDQQMLRVAVKFQSPRNKSPKSRESSASSLQFTVSKKKQKFIWVKDQEMARRFVIPGFTQFCWERVQVVPEPVQRYSTSYISEPESEQQSHQLHKIVENSQDSQNPESQYYQYKFNNKK